MLLYQKNGSKVMVLNKGGTKATARFLMHAGHCTRLIGEPEVIEIKDDEEEASISKMKVKRMGAAKMDGSEGAAQVGAPRGSKRMRGVMQGGEQRQPPNKTPKTSTGGANTETQTGGADTGPNTPKSSTGRANRGSSTAGVNTGVVIKKEPTREGPAPGESGQPKTKREGSRGTARLAAGAGLENASLSVKNLWNKNRGEQWNSWVGGRSRP